MTLDEILALDKVASSIRYVDAFLSSQTKDYAYYRALSYKALILHTIGKDMDATKILISVTPLFSSMTEDSICAIADGIIELALDNKEFDQAKKYIDIKEKNIKPSEMKSLYLSKIKYFELTNNFSEEKRSLLTYLNDDLSDLERYDANQKLANIYYDERDYESFNNIVPEVLNYASKNFLYKDYNSYNAKKLNIIFESGNYLETIALGKKMLDGEEDDEVFKITIASIILKCYVKTGDYQRGTIIESNYTDSLAKITDKRVIKDFIKAALDLYTHIGHKFSIDLYSKKLEEIDQEIKQETKKTKRVQTRKLDTVPNFSALEEEYQQVENEAAIKDEYTNKTKVFVKNYKQSYISVAYENIEEIVNVITSYDLAIKFREVFRQAGVLIEEKFEIEEMILLYNDSEYYGFHYKKERCYDKKFTLENIKKSLNFYVYNHADDYYMDDSSDLRGNIITNSVYPAGFYGFGIPLEISEKKFGSLCFYSSKRFFDKDLTYESLKIITSLINSRLAISMSERNIERANNKLFFITDYMSSGLKDEIDGYIHLNKRSCELLKVKEDILCNEYNALIDSKDLASYLQIKESVFTLMSLNKDSYYHFKKGSETIYVHERFYPMYENGTIRILSLIDDETKTDLAINELRSLAYTNPVTNLYTKAKLYDDIELCLENKKFAIALINISDFKLYNDLYGFSFGDDLIKEIGRIFKDTISNDFSVETYHLESDKFVLLFKNNNDKRSIASKTLKILDTVSGKTNSINKRLKISFKAGVFRYTKNLTLVDKDKMLFYASEGLMDAQLDKNFNNTVCMFNNTTYKHRFFEASLITHISECIDNNLLQINYAGIASLKENTFISYMAKYNLVNYDCDEALIKDCVKRRGIEELIDKHLISSVLRELKTFYDKKKAYINVTIPISATTFNSEGFNVFLKTQTQFFKIPNKALTIYITEENFNKNVAIDLMKSEFYIASNSLSEIFNHNINYYFHSYRKTSLDSNEVIMTIAKANNIDVVLLDIDKIEDLSVSRAKGFDKVFGKTISEYKKIKALIEEE